MRARSQALLAACFGPNGVQREECLLLVALLLIARGLYLIAPAAAYIVPGVVLLWIVLPVRARFVVPLQKPPEKPKPHRSEAR